MDTLYDTPFLESEAILAMQAGNEAHVKILLDKMLPNEIRSLEEACDRLSELCYQARTNG